MWSSRLLITDLNLIIVLLLSCLGDSLTYLSITSIMVILRRDLGVKVLLTLLISMYLNQVLKYWLNVPRPMNHLDIIYGLPPIIASLVQGEGPSLPSGHTQISSTFWTSLALNAPNKLTITATVLLPILIAYSRVALGVHTSLDIITALIIGYSIPLTTSLLHTLTRKYVGRYKTYVELSSLTLLLTFSIVSNYPKLPSITGLMVAIVLVNNLVEDLSRSFTTRLRTSLLSLITLVSGYVILTLVLSKDYLINMFTEFTLSLILGLIAYLIIPVKLAIFKLRSTSPP